MRTIPTEHDEQRAVVQWCDAMRVPVFAIPNGGHRHILTAAKLKAEGVKPGVPDLFVPIPNKQYHGMFVEMKATRGGRVSEYQDQWHALLRAQGYRVIVAHGASEAIREIGQHAGVEVRR